MPTYEYMCTECGEALEVVQKFSDDPLTVCPKCGGRLRKVFSPVGVVFKGSGFYRTDSRDSSRGSLVPGPNGASTGSADGDKPSSDKSSTEKSGTEKKASDAGSAASPGTATGSSSSNGGSAPTAGSGTSASKPASGAA